MFFYNYNLVWQDAPSQKKEKLHPYGYSLSFYIGVIQFLVNYF
jgi:hypothetical protein